MKKQLERIRNFSTEFSPDDTKSNFFLGKLIQAATSSKKLQKDILSNTTSIDKAQEDFYKNNDSGIRSKMSKEYKDSNKDLNNLTAKYPASSGLSEKAPEYLKRLYSMSQTVNSTLS